MAVALYAGKCAAHGGVEAYRLALTRTNLQDRYELREVLGRGGRLRRRGAPGSDEVGLREFRLAAN
jgi:hypothetical protein